MQNVEPVAYRHLQIKEHDGGQFVSFEICKNAVGALAGVDRICDSHFLEGAGPHHHDCRLQLESFPKKAAGNHYSFFEVTRSG
jgi:hypothetical protein